MLQEETAVDHDAQLPGISLHYATWGDPAGRPVLLIHGLTANSRSWAAVGPALAERGFYAVAPDLRGRGGSDKPAHGYSIPQHAGDLVSLCDILSIPAACVVGHSLGAQITAYLAALHPQRANRIVMVDAGGPFPPDTFQAIAASVGRLDTVYPSLDAYLAAMGRLPIHPWNDFFERYYRYDAQARPDGTVTSRAPRTAVEEEIRAVSTIRLDAVPAMVQAPALICRATDGLLGPGSGLILPAEQAEGLVAAMPDARLIDFPGTNHYTILCSDALVREISNFLA